MAKSTSVHRKPRVSDARSLLAGIDLLTGKVHALVRDRHRSREFVEFLKLLDAAYPAHTTIKLILDNHSAHISKETKAWLADQPAGRFAFTFTPKHGSWLNLVEGFFSKLARSVPRSATVVDGRAEAVPMPDDASPVIIGDARCLWPAPVPWPLQLLVQLAFDHGLDKAAHPFTHRGFNRIEPIVEKIHSRISDRLRGSRLRGNALLAWSPGWRSNAS